MRALIGELALAIAFRGSLDTPNGTPGPPLRGILLAEDAVSQRPGGTSCASLYVPRSGFLLPRKPSAAFSAIPLARSPVLSDDVFYELEANYCQWTQQCVHRC
jgi:hypothetical protein